MAATRIEAWPATAAAAGALLLQLPPHWLRIGSHMTACRILGFLLKISPCLALRVREGGGGFGSVALVWLRAGGWVWMVLEVLLSTCQYEHSCLQGLRVRHCFTLTSWCVMPA